MNAAWQRWPFLGRICRSRFPAGDLKTMSTVTTQMDKDGIAVLTINNPPVNVLEPTTLESYANEIRALDENESCRGVIIASACDRAFSAGLNINEFRSGDRDRLRSYWKLLHEMWYQTYRSRLATVAAVNGAAIAGGCVLAMSCDVRVMVDSGARPSIGLNETKLGITVPFWLSDRLIQLVGHHKAEQALLPGLIFDTREALSFGLVDRVVESRNALMDAARQEMKKLLEIPDHTRAQTKRRMRQPLLEKFVQLRKQDVNEFVDMICDSRTQAVLENYLQLQKKRKRQ